MKKTPIIVTAILMALTANVWAGSSDQKVIDQAAKNSVTVAQATNLADHFGLTPAVIIFCISIGLLFLVLFLRHKSIVVRMKEGSVMS